MANKLMAKVTKANPKPPPNPMSSDSDMIYRARDALHTLKRADEIQRDKGLMRHVKMCAKQEIKSLSKLAGKRK
jgi:hypothetical protein